MTYKLKRQNLINERISHEKSKQQMADMLKISVRQYSRMEDGTSDGHIKNWVKLSKMFKKSINFLLEQDKRQKPDGNLAKEAG